MWRDRTAWALGTALGVSMFNAYAYFAWLPEMLSALTGASPAGGGAALALYAALALPCAVVVPTLAVQLRRPAGLVVVAGGVIVVGNLGLLLVPERATLLSVVAAGLGPLLYPLCMALILRLTASESAAASLTGFSSCLGYALGALGPLSVGITFDATDRWALPLLILTSSGVVAVIAGIALSRSMASRSEPAPGLTRAAETSGPALTS